ncbi:MAG: signal recognition particle-docking protein FtsY [Desulfobacterales bacterium]|nr:MAG: signal recognition particle-docking protein FtsY [Desulfobacterales bacterium]
MALKWFKKKKRTDSAPEDLAQQEPAAEQIEAETPISEPSIKGIFFGPRKKKPDTPPEEPIQEEQAPSLEQPKEPRELNQTEHFEEETPVSQAPKEGVFRRLRNRLSKTRKAFTTRIDNLLLGKKEIDEELLEDLEEILITSDIGVQTTMALVEQVREGVEKKDLSNPEELKHALQDQIVSFLKVPSKPVQISQNKPHVIMVIGVNGVGKTTTIGKLSDRYIQQGRRVLLIAGDTFRAAAVEQLEIWGERVGAEIICHKGHDVKPSAKIDPSAVVYDGIQAAMARGVDVVMIDTAGRLHTKVNLMEQLKKIRRTVARQIPDAPHEILLVLDATTGQNAISQAQLFHEALEITGIVLTKLDGTAKGGIVVGISQSLKLPIQYIGLGEKANDLQDFDADVFARALF